jgi:hypothetical protein
MPHQGQQTIIRDPARLKWLTAGRRWRKTTLAMTQSVEHALRGKTILWGAPTFDQCNIGWTEMQKAAGAVADFRRSRMEVLFPTGGRVIFRSLDNPDNARGHTADGVIVDEAPIVPEQAWYDVLRPIISDTGGWALLMGTPKGRNWFWREWMAAGDAPDSSRWQVPTLGVKIVEGRLTREPHALENPDFPFVEAERMYQSLPQRTFEQEFLAQFIEDAGLVFRGVRAVSTVKPGEHGYFERYRFVMGVDWAKAYDWTVISVIDATNKRQVAMERFNQIDYQFQLGRLKTMCERWHPSLIIAEANAMGTPLIEQLQRSGLPVRGFTTTAQSKAEVIEALALAIERKSISLLGNETQIAELEAFDMERLPGGSFRYGAPSGMHDDTVMALALAWYGATAGTTHRARVREY